MGFRGDCLELRGLGFGLGVLIRASGFGWFRVRGFNKSKGVSARGYDEVRSSSFLLFIHVGRINPTELQATNQTSQNPFLTS